MILPFIKRQQAYEVIQSLVPEMRFNTAHTGMPLRGFHRHFLIPSLILIIASFIDGISGLRGRLLLRGY